MMKEEEVEQFVKPANKFSFEDEDEEMVFNPGCPVSSFKRMVQYNKQDLVLSALGSLSKFIEQKSAFSVTNEGLMQLIECAR